MSQNGRGYLQTLIDPLYLIKTGNLQVSSGILNLPERKLSRKMANFARPFLDVCIQFHRTEQNKTD